MLVWMRVGSVVSISIYLNTWSSVGETVWKGLEDIVVGRGLSLGEETEVSKPPNISSFSPLFPPSFPLSTVSDLLADHM